MDWERDKRELGAKSESTVSSICVLEWVGFNCLVQVGQRGEEVRLVW